MPSDTDRLRWERALLQYLLAQLQGEWRTHHRSAPGIALAFSLAPPGMKGDIIVGWCSSASDGMRWLAAHVPDPGAFQRYIAETPAAETVVVLVCQRSVSLHRMDLFAGPRVASV